MDSENRKFTVLSFLIFSSICGYIFYLILTQIADWFKWGGGNVAFGQSWAVVGGSIAGLFGLALLIGLLTNRTSSGFVDEVFAELKKTTWPSLKEASASTLVVSIMVTAAAFLLFVVDYFWGVFFRAIL